MFRFNNPDALLVLLLTLAAYATTRAHRAGRTRWLVLAGALVGFGFLTKMLQAFLVVPGFALVYLVAAPPPLRRRIWQLLAAGARAGRLPPAGGSRSSLLWPGRRAARTSAARSDNSVLELIFGYNGFGRLTGNETGGSVGGQRTGPAGPAAGPAAASAACSAARPGSPGCSTPRSAARSPGCSRPRSIALVGRAVADAARAAHRPHPRRRAALGRLAARDRRWSSAHGRASSTRTTRSRSPRRSARSSASAPSSCGGAAAHLVARPSSPPRSWSPRSGPACCSTAAPTGTRGSRVLIVVAGVAAAGDVLPAGVRADRGRRRTSWRQPRSLALIAGLAAPLAYSIETGGDPHAGAVPSAGPTVAGSFGIPGGGPGARP